MLVASAAFLYEVGMLTSMLHQSNLCQLDLLDRCKYTLTTRWQPSKANPLLLQVLLAPHHLQRWVVRAKKVFLPQFCQHCLSGHPGNVCCPDFYCFESAPIQEVLWLLDYAGEIR